MPCGTKDERREARELMIAAKIVMEDAEINGRGHVASCSMFSLYSLLNPQHVCSRTWK